MTHEDLLTKMNYCKDVIEAFQESVAKGNSNSFDIAFKMGEWKQSLLKSIYELQDELRKSSRKPNECIPNKVDGNNYCACDCGLHKENGDY